MKAIEVHELTTGLIAEYFHGILKEYTTLFLCQSILDSSDNQINHMFFAS